jgi:hypothetical protein
MFSETYTRIKAKVMEEWRLMRAQTTLEYSQGVHSVLEIAPLNIYALQLHLALSPLRYALQLLRLALGAPTSDSRVRFPWETVEASQKVWIW